MGQGGRINAVGMAGEAESISLSLESLPKKKGGGISFQRKK